MQNNPYEFLTLREIDVQNISPFHSKVTLEPFDSGFGHTVGTTLSEEYCCRLCRVLRLLKQKLMACFMNIVLYQVYKKM